jgi:CBS domain-containing protein
MRFRETDTVPRNLANIEAERRLGLSVRTAGGSVWLTPVFKLTAFKRVDGPSIRPSGFEYRDMDSPPYPRDPVGNDPRGGPMRAGDLMRANVPEIAPGDSVLDAARRMVGAGVKAIPVCEGGLVVGILTDWDLVRALADGSDACAKPVANFMTREVVSLDVDASLTEAGPLMAEHRIHHLVISDAGRFAGMLHLDVEWSELGGLGAPHATFAAPI